VMLPSEAGRPVFWIDPDLIAGTSPEAVNEHVRGLLERRTGRKLAEVQAEPSRDSTGRLNGYVARARF
jgi:hypothetical protein